MKAFLWYKAKLVLKPCKIAGLVILPAIYMLLYTFLKIGYETMMSFAGLAIPLIYSYVMFSAGDLFRINCYIAAGQDSRKIWMANLILITATGAIMSLLSQTVTSLAMGHPVSETLRYLLTSLCLIPFTMLMLGLSMLHYRSYSKFEIVFASVFAVMNIFAFFIPLLDLLIPIALSLPIAACLGGGGLLGMIVLFYYMGTGDNETLVRNACKEVSDYDRVMLGMDEG